MNYFSTNCRHGFIISVVCSRFFFFVLELCSLIIYVAHSLSWYFCIIPWQSFYIHIPDQPPPSSYPELEFPTLLQVCIMSCCLLITPSVCLLSLSFANTCFLSIMICIWICFEHKSTKVHLFSKIDLEKAYDHVSWDFLLYMLKRCGFGGKWCSWIVYCISLVRFLVLVNNSPRGFFSSSRGLRQWDPLSLLLFVFVMETLGRMISVAVSGGLLAGFSVGIWVDTFHLLFADDTFFFFFFFPCVAGPNYLCNLWSSFLCFEAVSSLKTNLAKLELISVGWASWDSVLWGYVLALEVSWSFVEGTL